jgi:DNA-binding LacI/PurR family transcriptional regulator
MSKQTSIQDVAAEAKVSAMTVSRVINQHPRVSAATAEKVHKAIEKLGYSSTPSLRRRGRPSRAHKGLHTGQIAMLLLGAKETLHNPVIERTVFGAHQTLQSKNLNLLVLNVESVKLIPDLIDRKSIDGVIVTGFMPKGELLGLLHSIPSVCIYNFEEGDRTKFADHIVPDNQKISSLAAETFLKKGIDHIAYFDPSPGHPEFKNRGLFFQKAFSGKNVKIDIFQNSEKQNIHSANEPDVQRELFDEQIKSFLSNPNRAKGVFLPSDLVTAIFHRRLREMGYDPSQFEIVTCNNEKPFLESLYPQPTTIDIHAEDIGSKAAERLLVRIENQDLACEKITIPPQLSSPQ